jgi:DNA-binding HxlR family transcriptional regulator
MLTLTLRSLEGDGLVERTVKPHIPPHVPYGLTELGRSLCVPVRARCEWTEENVAVIGYRSEAIRKD